MNKGPNPRDIDHYLDYHVFYVVSLLSLSLETPR